MEITTKQPETALKLCAQCGSVKPLAEFENRRGGGPGRRRRRGTCRSCRREARQLHESATSSADTSETVAETSKEDAVSTEPAYSEPKKRKRRRRRKVKQPATATKRANSPPVPAVAPFLASPLPVSALVPVPRDIKIAARKRNIDPLDASALRATRQGFVRMRGKTDNGRSYYQEIEPELAKILVRENAAYVVNRHTIRRIYSNREFRKLILTRDGHTCYFCGQYGDTIDHLLPRAKGGHTTPVNCVCACNECNHSKADRDLDEFTESIARTFRSE